MVEISVGGDVELEGSEADIVESLVIDTEGLVRVLDQLVDGEGSVVRLDNGVGDLGVHTQRTQSALRSAIDARIRPGERRAESIPWARERLRRWPSFDRGTPLESWR